MLLFISKKASFVVFLKLCTLGKTVGRLSENIPKDKEIVTNSIVIKLEYVKKEFYYCVTTHSMASNVYTSLIKLVSYFLYAKSNMY